MQVLAGIAGALLVGLILYEFFVTFMLPRPVSRDPRIARGLDALLWPRWRALATHLTETSADALLGFFAPLALLVQLLTWTVGLTIGFGLIEWAVAGGSLEAHLLTSGELFLSVRDSSGSV